MKTTLAEWAARHFTPTPSLHTLRRMAREGKITPPPMLVGREYYVEETATLVGDTPPAGGLVQRISRGTR